MDQRRPRTFYAAHRAHRRGARIGLIVGGLIGLVFAAYALLPLMLAGERVPPLSYLVGLILVIAPALLLRALVRWRWHRVKMQWDE